jgi:sterol-4alpha-carboxylate 3-dehydrogenase (decarboxylating)
MSLDNASILITGGCGQIGLALITHLQTHHPTASLAVLDLATPAPAAPCFIDNVTYFAGTLTDNAFVAEVFAAVKPLVVFHTAGMIPSVAKRLKMDTREGYAAVNVQGTRNVLEAAAAGSVRAFVFTSSCDVVKGDSWRDLVNVNESMPIPKVFDDPYAESKVILAVYFSFFRLH